MVPIDLGAAVEVELDADLIWCRVGEDAILGDHDLERRAGPHPAPAVDRAEGQIASQADGGRPGPGILGEETSGHAPDGYEAILVVHGDGLRYSWASASRIEP